MRKRKGFGHFCNFTDKVKDCFGKGQCKKIEAPLSEKGFCTKVKVCKVTGDRKICARMASLGLYPGVEADVVCAQRGSQCVVKVNGGTISLDSSISDNIYVTEI